MSIRDEEVTYAITVEMARAILRFLAGGPGACTKRDRALVEQFIEVLRHDLGT